MLKIKNLGMMLENESKSLRLYNNSYFSNLFYEQYPQNDNEIYIVKNMIEILGVQNICII